MGAVGVDTHKQRHYAVALDLLGELSFAASAAGYAELQPWAERLDDAQQLVFGVEGAGSWGPAFASTCNTLVTPCSKSSVHVDANVARASPTALTH